MAKPLSLVFQGKTLDMQLEKVERAKLYGFVETEVVDEQGKRCELGTLIADGHSVVGKGGTAIAYLSPDGAWRKKADLKPVDLNGNAIVPVKSTFDAPVTLEATASIDEFLSHNIESIYLLHSENELLPIKNELQKGTIYQFPFSFRGGLEASAGFVLMGSDGNIFLCIGSPTKFEFVHLETLAAPVAEDTDASDEDDSLDFGIV